MKRIFFNQTDINTIVIVAFTTFLFMAMLFIMLFLYSRKKIIQNQIDIKILKSRVA